MSVSNFSVATPEIDTPMRSACQAIPSRSRGFLQSERYDHCFDDIRQLVLVKRGGMLLEVLKT